ncbi:hypothetical protein [Planktotalea sp.]|uniref:hypothetical protein n=1 Tax=Planktotalea sp. TaxID=2029877 RepID=UPI003F6D2467
MPRWLLWTPIAALTVATAFFGLRAGWHVSALTESDVINRAAANYLSGDAMRQATDCEAKPSEVDDVWLIVICRASTGETEIYQANRYGRVQLGSTSYGQPET